MLKFFKLVCVLMLLLLLPIQGMAEQTYKLSEPLKYEKFLEERAQDNVVILDAAQLEKYFMLVPEDVAAAGKGISQKQLDSLLVSLIPSKGTKVVLYCYQNFEPTRRMSAGQSVALSLIQNGYTNVETLEDLWGNGSAQEYEKAQRLGKTEVIPYAKKIPENYPLENKSE